jgi:methylated-DNA-protein-cysteine methyltransferase-like protein
MSPKYTSPSNKVIYNNQVWEVVLQIPHGKVATYGQIASLIPPPEGMPAESYRKLSPRWVGAAMAGSPKGIPWQRVINASGKISLSGESAQRQRELLEDDGVEFDERGRIDLKRFQWITSDKEKTQLELPI